MTHRERIETVLRGERPDRAPAAFWRHHPRHEVTMEGLVEATLSFQRRYDWDLVKINPRAEYHSEAWGNRYAFFLDDHRRPQLIEPRVRSAADWRQLAVLDPTDGVLGEHLQAVRRIRQELGPDVPVVMTVFSPLSIATELAGVRDTRPADVLAYGDELLAGLRTITDTFVPFVRELLAAGCDGIYFATTRVGTRTTLSDEQFVAFGRPFDIEVLAAARSGWLNMLHCCGAQCMLNLVLDYPVQLLSWDMADSTNPPGPEIVRTHGRAVIGGVAQQATANPTRLAEVLDQVRALWAATGGLRTVIGAGCVVPTNVDPQTLAVIRATVDDCD